VREALCEVKEMLDQIQGYQTFTSLSTRLIVIEKTTYSGVPARKGHDSVITFGNLTWSVDMNGKKPEPYQCYRVYSSNNKMVIKKEQVN
jgi:hypothetical protein